MKGHFPTLFNITEVAVSICNTNINYIKEKVMKSKTKQKTIVDQSSNLFPPYFEEASEVADFLSKLEEVNGYPNLLESKCGVTDDSQPVEQYDGTLGVSVAFVNNRQRPVGQIQWNNDLATIYSNPGNVSGIRWCTGTLISNDLFLTAGHCFQEGNGWRFPRNNTTGATISPSEAATNMQINFNYQVDPSGDLRVEQSFPILDLVEDRLGNLDYAIVRLGGIPGATYGTSAISTTDASVGDMACIIGHPAGVRKRIEAGPVTDLHGNSIGYNDIDTLGGNSGSGILRASDGLIVGVHTNGGCRSSDPDSDTAHNHGVRITSIIAQSPTIRSLTTRIGTGVQFRGTLNSHQTTCWFTFNWPAHWHVFWHAMSLTPGAKIKWNIRTERADDNHITYWICITNLTDRSAQVEGRYAVLGSN